MVDPVAKQVSAVTPALGRDAFRQHFQNAVVLFALQVAVGVGTAHHSNSASSSQSSQLHMATICCARMSSGAVGNLNAVEIALLDGPDCSRTFHQIVASGGEQASFGDGSAPVTSATHSLQRHRDRARRIDLAN